MLTRASTSVPVAIVGGGIPGLVAAYELTRRGTDFVLLESEARIGGKILTEHVDGFVLEGGPDSFMTFKPAALNLCRSLGIEGRLQGTRGPMRSFVRRRGRLYPLPTGLSGLAPLRLRPLITTGVISLVGKARAGLELFLPPRADGEEESIAEFATRRFGREVYEWAVEPLLAGIHAADGEALSVRATYPMLSEIELNHGSILRRALRASRAGPRDSSPFVTPVGGTSEIVEALARTLPAGSVRTRAAVQRVERPGRYRVAVASGSAIAADAVIVTGPAHVASVLLAPLDGELAARLATIPFTSTVTVSLAFREEDVRHPLDGTGYLSPRAEGGPVVACTWASSKFAGRAPMHRVLLRVFMGRAGANRILDAESDTLVEAARQEVRETMAIAAAPILTRVHRWPRGIPQYNLGHAARVAAIEASVARQPGLFVAGASYHGSGLPDCVEAGGAAARAASAFVQSVSPPT